MAMTVYKDQQVIKTHTDGRGSGLIVDTVFGSTTTATPLVIASIPVPVLSMINISLRVCGLRSDATEAIRANINSGFRRQAAGNVTEIGADTAIASAEDSAGTPAVALVANTSAQTVEVQVTGEASKTIHWEVILEYHRIQL